MSGAIRTRTTTAANRVAHIVVLTLFSLAAGRCLSPRIHAAESSVPFTGDKTAWHGFDRYDFHMDEATLSITPMKAAEDEKNGIAHTIDGQRRCERAGA